jgi:hemolysin III
MAKRQKTQDDEKKDIKIGINNRSELINSLTHLIGTVLSVAGLVLLVVFAALKSTAWHIVSFSIFGASMILLYLTSTLYHFFSHDSKAKRVFLRIDHSMIYVLIAGSYTPLCLTILRGPFGWTLLGIIWAIAITGIVIKSTGIKINEYISTAGYIIMGWLLVIAIGPLVKILPGIAIFWLFLGGISYTVGAIFYSLDKKIIISRWFGMHEIFHLFVMLGSFSHFWLMFRYVLYL